MKREGARAAQVPSEMVTTSGAGLDPHIPPEAADLQAPRVARARGVDVSRVRELVRAHTEAPTLGLPRSGARQRARVERVARRHLRAFAGRRAGRHVRSRAQHFPLGSGDHGPGGRRCAEEARSAHPVQEPGDVHRRARQRRHHRHLGPGARCAHAGHPLFTGQVAFWLWFTVIFANFAEAMAEGRGKAQAATLRQAKADTTAHADPRRAQRESVPAQPRCAPATWCAWPRASSFPATARSSRAWPASTSRRSPASRRRSSASPAAIDRPSPAARACSRTGSSSASPPTPARPSSIG